MDLRVAPVKSRSAGSISTRQAGLNTARSRSAAVTGELMPVESRVVQPMATLPPGLNTARSTSAPSSQGRSDPGGTTVPFSSSQIRPCSVS